MDPAEFAFFWTSPEPSPTRRQGGRKLPERKSGHCAMFIQCDSFFQFHGGYMSASRPVPPPCLLLQLLQVLTCHAVYSPIAPPQPSHITARHTTSCHVMPRHATSWHVMPEHFWLNARILHSVNGKGTLLGPVQPLCQFCEALRSCQPGRAFLKKSAHLHPTASAMALAWLWVTHPERDR